MHDDDYDPESDDASDVEGDCIIDEEEESKSDSSDDENIPNSAADVLWSKDNIQWSTVPTPQGQLISRNILRQRPGPIYSTSSLTAKEIFKCFISKEMCDIIIRETNRKGKEITQTYNDELLEKYPDSTRSRPKEF